MENNAKVNWQNDRGLCALHEAARSPSEDIVDLLVELGADVNLRSSEGRTALHYAATADPTGNICRKLLDRGADVGAVTAENKTALHYATSAEVVETVLRAHYRRVAAACACATCPGVPAPPTATSSSSSSAAPAAAPAAAAAAARANKICRTCKGVAYCSAECQRADWLRGHRERCRGGVTTPFIDIVDTDGRTAWHTTRLDGFFAAADALVAAGVRADVVDTDGRTADEYEGENNVMPGGPPGCVVS